MNTATMYHEVLKMEYQLQQYTEKFNKIISGKEYYTGGLVDAIVKFLKGLKEFAVGTIYKLFKFIERNLSYDNYITLKNLFRSKRIERGYRKLDTDDKLKFDKQFEKAVMSNCYVKNQFYGAIARLEMLSRFGAIDFANALKLDISSLTAENTTWQRKLEDLKVANVEYDRATNKFTMTDTFDIVSGKTFKELEFNSVDDVFKLINAYERVLPYYKDLIKLPSTLRALEYRLNQEIDNITHDPTLAEGVARNAQELSKSIHRGISAVRNYIDLIRSYSTSINVKISAMLNRMRTLLSRRGDILKANESLVPSFDETIVVVTNNEVYNRRMEDIKKVNGIVRETILSKKYPHIRYMAVKCHTDRFPEVIQFCKREADYAILTTGYMTDEHYNTDITDEETKQDMMNFLTDVNGQISHAGISMEVSIDPNSTIHPNLFRCRYIGIREVPDMDVDMLLETADLLCRR